MSDLILNTDDAKDVLLVERQKAVRKGVVEQYIQCRKSQKITQAVLAEKIGIARPNITRFENESYNPTIDMLVKIADSLGKDVEIRLVDKVQK